MIGGMNRAAAKAALADRRHVPTPPCDHGGVHSPGSPASLANRPARGAAWSTDGHRPGSGAIEKGRGRGRSGWCPLDDPHRGMVSRSFSRDDLPMFNYVFDLGDNWQHRCSVLSTSVDPVEVYGMVPRRPIFRTGVGGGSRTSTAAAGRTIPGRTLWRKTWMKTGRSSKRLGDCVLSSILIFQGFLPKRVYNPYPFVHLSRVKVFSPKDLTAKGFGALND